jgi:hypothetical protein
LVLQPIKLVYSMSDWLLGACVPSRWHLSMYNNLSCTPPLDGSSGILSCPICQVSSRFGALPWMPAHCSGSERLSSISPLPPSLCGLNSHSCHPRLHSEAKLWSRIRTFGDFLSMELCQHCCVFTCTTALTVTLGGRSAFSIFHMRKWCRQRFHDSPAVMSIESDKARYTHQPGELNPNVMLLCMIL